MTRALIVAALAAMVVLLIVGCSLDRPGVDSGETGCRPLTPTRVGCTTLEVPMIHSNPAAGTLTLRVFVAPSFVKPRREPAIFLQGGPGGSVGGLWDSGFAQSWANLLGRDVVLLEQRGNKLSKPALECRFPTADDAPIEAYEQALTQCRDDYRIQSNIQLEAFNSVESAHDVEDVRRALGVEKLIVWGSSYGALLASVVAREHPSSVAALMLESPSLASRPYRSIEALDVRPGKIAAFTAWLKTACAAQPDCATAYPGLDPQAELDALLARVKATGPVALTPTIVIDSPATLQAMVFLSMYFTPHAVLLVRAIYADNRGLLDQFDRDTRLGKVGVRDYLTDVVDFSDVIASATNIVVNCYDNTRNWTDDGLAKLVLPNIPAEDRAAIDGEIAETRRLCAVLPPPSVDPSLLGQPITTSIPTLFVGGTLDATTPIEWADAELPRFSQARVITVPCIGHGVAGAAKDCFGVIANDFFVNKNPSAIDPSCTQARCNGSEDKDLFVERFF